ncbi:Ribokinase-like protein, partial [Ochromonadaceae sp. CCMP2298]
LSSALVPSLQQTAHKGSMGRVGVIGGCAEYSGAPYYAALSGLKVGADLSWVLCSEKASVPIKSYTPELMVTPFYADDMLDRFPRGSDEYAQLVQGYAQSASASLPRMQALVVGPGLGRHPLVLDAVALVLASARSRNMPIVVDADGLWLVTQNLATVRGYGRCILTPNRVEFDRLVEAVTADLRLGSDDYSGASSGVSTSTSTNGGDPGVRSMGGLGGTVYAVVEKGSPRRCGGQGDILAGALGVVYNW